MVTHKIEKLETFTASESNHGERLDKFVIDYLPKLSRTLVQDLIKEKLILVNKKKSKAGYKLRKDDVILVSIPAPKKLEVKAEDIALDIKYEDSEVIVINKPQGMVTHPASGQYEGTLVNALLAHCKESLSGINGILRPGIVHRLDKDTSGLILACKNDFSHNEIAKQIKSRSLSRKYYAIVHGSIKYDKGIIKKPIGRHKVQRHKMAVVLNGREAITHWKVLKRFDKYTFLELSLETGRTHQIRVHMSSINHPIVGDKTYGKKSEKIPASCFMPPASEVKMMLHAYKLSFMHPESKKIITLETDIPDRMSSFMMNL